MPEAVIIGGPNGAGKTSWALRYLKSTLGVTEFVNADEIARGLSPLNPDNVAFAAGRILVQRLHALASARQSFAFETTCAGRSHLRFLESCRACGYRTTLIFLWLPSVEAAIDRVARRVSQGGHSVPDPVIRRRYQAGLKNMRLFYLPFSDIALIYNNWDKMPHLIAEHRLGSSVVIHDRVRWGKIEDVAQ